MVAAKVFISLAVGRIGRLIDVYIDAQYEYQKGERKKLVELANSLKKIQALLDVAQEMEIKKPSLVEWLSQLKNAVYDAEYVMDVFEYQRIKNEVEGWPETTVVMNKGKVLNFLKLSCGCCSKIQESASVVVKRLFFSDEDLNDLLRVVGKFDKLVNEMDKLILLLGLENAMKNAVARPFAADYRAELRKTTSTLVETLFGRYEEEKKLLDLVLHCSNVSETKFSVVSVVGVGGVGKTALAQSIFNHEKVNDHFEVQAWTCASINFSIESLMKSIIEDARIKKPNDFYSLENLGSIQDVLKSGLQSKRFLIVIDDVWEDMQDKWEKICMPFLCGKEGSKIMITSRSREVVNFMGAEEKMQIDLSPLPFDIYFDFFQKCAFRSENPERFPHLKKIGEKIADDLGGLPLAAKVVGGALCTKLNIDHWRGILNSKVWKEKENGIMYALKLSYEHLPTHLKKCFAYCCLFPKDYKYNAKTLVDIWIALDCVGPADINKRVVDIQRDYIHELVSRCFLDVHSTSKIKDDGEDCYVIHDLLHDLAESIIGNEVYRVEDSESLSKDVPHSVRHLYVNLTVGSDISLDLPLQKLSPKQLRSLVCVAKGEERLQRELKISEETIQKLKGLRLFFFLPALNSSLQCKMMIPENLGYIRHLRCINFYFSRFDLVFPTSFRELYQLEILRWRCEIHNFEQSNYLHKLINLRYIDHIQRFPDNPLIKSYLGRLKSLEVVPGGVFKVDKKEGNDIGQLAELNNIGGELALDVHIKLSEAEAKKAYLNHKQYIKSFRIFEEEDGGIGEEAIEALQPHENIEELDIAYCKIITRTPSWLPMLSSLTKLGLYNLPNLQGLPPHLGYDLLSLKELHLSSLPLLKQINVAASPVNYHGVVKLFPSVTVFSLHNLKILEGWSFYNSWNKDSTINFPKLSKININGCPKLLMKGDLSNCIIFPFPSPNCSIRVVLFRNISRVTYIEAEEMIVMSIDGESLLSNAHDYSEQKTSMLLVCIKEMIIIEGIQYLIDMNLLLSTLSQKFTSLEMLTIDKCDEESLDNIAHHLPAASYIKKLIIRECSKFKFLCGNSLQTLFSSLEMLIVDDCRELESLVRNSDNGILLPSSVKSLTLKRCESLKFLYLLSFPSLETLEIEDCYTLQSLADHNTNNDDDTNHFPPSINKLVIKKCPELKLSRATLQILPSVRMFVVEGCKELEESLHAQQQQPTSTSTEASLSFTLVYIEDLSNMLGQTNVNDG